MEQRSPEQMHAAALRQMLTKHFNDNELRNLCQDLNIDYENLGGQGKEGKARELVAYVGRHARAEDLVARCRRLRPDADWQNISQTNPPGRLRQVARMTSKEQVQPEVSGREAYKPTIGVITAIWHEFAAVKAILENTEEIVKGDEQQPYTLGMIRTANGSGHLLSLTLLPTMGNNPASSRATLLLQHFPSIKWLIMVGIGGGIPQPDKPDEHVRLGDVVISNQYGVVQYDFNKETTRKLIFRAPPRPPNAQLLEYVGRLRADAMAGSKPWLEWIDKACKRLNVNRPSEDTDVLHVTVGKVGRKLLREPKPHPRDPERECGKPRIFIGPVGSANTLLKNPTKRDLLRKCFSLLAIDMEGSGIADATWMNGSVGYLIVRGISDYCDELKNDTWQPYAAITAAAYARALIQSIPGSPLPADLPKTSSSLQTVVSDLAIALDEVRSTFSRETLWADQCQRVQEVFLVDVLTALDTLETILDSYPAASQRQVDWISDLSLTLAEMRDSTIGLQRAITTLVGQPNQRVQLPANKRESILRLVDRLHEDLGQFHEL